MSIKLLNLVIAITISALVAFGFWSAGGALSEYLAVGSFLSISITLGALIGISIEHERRGVNSRILSGIFLSIVILAHLIFLMADFSNILYIITLFILLLLFILMFNFIKSSQQ